MYEIIAREVNTGKGVKVGSYLELKECLRVASFLSKHSKTLDFICQQYNPETTMWTVVGCFYDGRLESESEDDH